MEATHPTVPRRARTKRLALVFLLIGLVSFGGMVYAFVNEALSAALEAATPYVEQGFEVREDNWSGEATPGKPLLVQHQVFRGNEYWFWAGTSWPGASVRVDVFDSNGNGVALETFAEGPQAGARALPESTGTYNIRVITEYDPESPAAKEAGDIDFEGMVDWGLVYGYR